MSLYVPEVGLSQYKTLMRGVANFANGNGASTYVIWTNGSIANQGASSAFAMVYLDPADYATGGKTNYCRVRYAVATNATASTINYTFGLYPVTAFGGAANVVAVNTGTVVSGSQPSTLTAPAASTFFEGHSADFAMPAAGYYALGCVLSGTMAANSALVGPVYLERREV